MQSQAGPGRLSVFLSAFFSFGSEKWIENAIQIFMINTRAGISGYKINMLSTP
jgi:hypothetical protein